MKPVMKILVSAVMRLLSLPLYLFYMLESIFLGKRKAFGMVTQFVSLLPGLSGEWFRRAFLQWVTGLKLSDCCFSFGTTFSDPRIIIEDGVYLGRDCDIGYTYIGHNCLLGSGVHILSGLQQHVFENGDIPIKEQKGEYSKITIGEDTWVGNGAIIAADVGKKCVIGAGSVVVKPIEDFSIVAGNPAKLIRYRKNSIDKKKHTEK